MNHKETNRSAMAAGGLFLPVKLGILQKILQKPGEKKGSVTVKMLPPCGVYLVLTQNKKKPLR